MASQDFLQETPRSTSFADDDEEQPLTGKSGKDILNAFEADLNRKKNRFLTLSLAYAVALHLVVVILAFLLLKRPSLKADLLPLYGRTWSPVQPFIEYEVKGEHASHDSYNNYSGPPTTEKDAAWTHLLRPLAFNATLNELQRAEESTDGDLAKLDGGGYLASLGVYHELHCLRKLRHFLYREHYFEHANLTQAQLDYMVAHLDHCIDALRLTIMCHGSTEVYSFEWDDPSNYKPAAKSSAKSVCVKWSSIEVWAYSRMTSYEKLVR